MVPLSVRYVFDFERSWVLRMQKFRNHFLAITPLPVLVYFHKKTKMFLYHPTTYPPSSTWPHLRCDVGLEEGEYWKKLSVLQYCVLL